MHRDRPGSVGLLNWEDLHPVSGPGNGPGLILIFQGGNEGAKTDDAHNAGTASMISICLSAREIRDTYREPTLNIARSSHFCFLEI